MHQTVADRPRGNGLAQRWNQSILQRLRTNDTFDNKKWDVDLLFAEIQLNNLISNSLRLSSFKIDEGRTTHFPLNFPRLTSHAHEPLTLSDYLHRAEPSILCARGMLRNADAKCMWSYKWTDTRECLRWESEYRHKGKLDLVLCRPYKVFEVFNKGENVKLDIPVPFDRLFGFNCDSIMPYIHREGQRVWEFPIPPGKTVASP